MTLAASLLPVPSHAQGANPPPAGTMYSCIANGKTYSARGRSLRDEIAECARLSHPHGRVTFAVVFCTSCANAQHPTIREMEDLAWVLQSDTKKHTIGFVRAKDLAPRHRFVLDDDDL